MAVDTLTFERRSPLFDVLTGGKVQPGADFDTLVSAAVRTGYGSFVLGFTLSCVARSVGGDRGSKMAAETRVLLFKEATRVIRATSVNAATGDEAIADVMRGAADSDERARVKAEQSNE